MSRPLIFISTHRVASGRGDDLRALAGEYVEFVRAHEPATLGLHLALDAGGTEREPVTVVRDRLDGFVRAPQVQP
jgi:hypothetical protein